MNGLTTVNLLHCNTLPNPKPSVWESKLKNMYTEQPFAETFKLPCFVVPPVNPKWHIHISIVIWIHFSTYKLRNHFLNFKCHTQRNSTSRPGASQISFGPGSFNAKKIVELVKIWRCWDTTSNSLDMLTILVLAPKNIRSKRVRIWNPLSVPTPPKALHHRLIWSEYSVSGSAAVSCAVPLVNRDAGQEIAGERKTTWCLKTTFFGERPRLAPADSCPPLRSVTGLPQTTCQDREIIQQNW